MKKSENLKLYCQEQLAYLLDEEYFQVDVIYEYDVNQYSINISNNPNERNLPLQTGDKLFNWNDVKDYIIPFIIRLEKDYDILSRVYFYEYFKKHKWSVKTQDWVGYTLNSIINDKINPNKIRVINITVSDKTPDTLIKRIKRFANF